MKYYISLLFIFAFVISIYSSENDLNKTDANIIGHVVDKKTHEHLPFITVTVKGTTIATVTDATGHYFLKGLPEGTFTLEVKLIGYKTEQIEVTIKKGTTQEINFELEENNVSLDEVVVSANRNETTRRMAPVLVNILEGKAFEVTNSCNVAEGLNFQPGLRVETNCQNCGFTQVRMNGLEGAYSQILIDSRPIFSALTGVYGLEQIPANMVERIEVVRGGGSALFGASAIAGTINIITKEPVRNSAQLSHSIMSIGGEAAFDNNTSFNASIVSDNHKLGVMVFGQKRTRCAYDQDGDGFSEIPKLSNRTLGFRSFIKTGIYSKITLEYHHMNEFRRGGDNLDKEPFQAYIAEQIESDVDGGSLKFDWFSADAKHHVSVFSSAQLTNRKSYYGGGDPVDLSTFPSTPDEEQNLLDRLNSYGRTKDLTYSIGSQYLYKMDELWFLPAELTTGIEYTNDDLTDRSGYRNESIDQEIDIKSFFLQNEWKNEKWGFLVGGRVDKHKLLKNAVVSPRANIRFNPTPDTNIRLSYGQGFRAPQLFDEDLHVEIAGGQHIISERDPNLKEEKSHSVSTSFDWYLQNATTAYNFLIEGFFTQLNNPFTTISAEQEDGSIVKTIVNSSGAKVYGINLEGRFMWTTLLQLQLGATFQRSRYDEARKWSADEDDDVKPEKRMMRTPDVYGYFIASLTPVTHFSFSFSGNYTGNMLVPHEAGVIEKNRTEKSRDFFEFNLKAAYEMNFYKINKLEINAGIQNIFNAYQRDFDKGPERASSYIYGPALPRSYFAGIKISI